MLGWIIEHLQPILVSGASASLFIFAVNKIFNEKSWRKFFRNLGCRASKAARFKFGKGFWEKIETFIQKRLNQAVEELNIGLDEDDNNTQNNVEPDEK